MCGTRGGSFLGPRAWHNVEWDCLHTAVLLEQKHGLPAWTGPWCPWRAPCPWTCLPACWWKRHRTLGHKRGREHHGGQSPAQRKGRPRGPHAHHALVLTTSISQHPLRRFSQQGVFLPNLFYKTLQRHLSLFITKWERHIRHQTVKTQLFPAAVDGLSARSVASRSRGSLLGHRPKSGLRRHQRAAIPLLPVLAARWNCLSQASSRKDRAQIQRCARG